MGKNLSSGGFRRAFMSGVCACVCVSVSFMSSGALASYSPVSDFSDGPVLHLTHPHVITHIYRPSEALKADFLEDSYPLQLPLLRGRENGGALLRGGEKSALFRGREESALLRGRESGKLFRGREAGAASPRLSAAGWYGAKEALRAPCAGGKEVRVASVCFVTDAGSCSSNGFGNTDKSSGSGDPDYGTPEELCRDAGFVNTPCPEGAFPDSYCPYDASYHSVCECAAEYNQVCNGAGEQGVGSACGGKYKECCSLCEGYDYTTIPDGYVQDGNACSACNGQTKYKIKINPCDGFIDCGTMGGESGAKTCLSGTVTKYENCKPCPNLGEYASCPEGTICRYEECSGLWYPTGCQNGYTDYCGYCAI